MSGLLSGYSCSFPRDILTPENLNCWVNFLGLCFFVSWLFTMVTSLVAYLEEQA